MEKTITMSLEEHDKLMTTEDQYQKRLAEGVESKTKKLEVQVINLTRDNEKLKESIRGFKSNAAWVDLNTCRGRNYSYENNEYVFVDMDKLKPLIDKKASEIAKEALQFSSILSLEAESIREMSYWKFRKFKKSNIPFSSDTPSMLDLAVSLFKHLTYEERIVAIDKITK